ncbi:MAG: hypothetical protein KC418_23670, partial [Anaerolineales bacterium]|nr:hypothetical protein [Anaerolineales bacterium]
MPLHLLVMWLIASALVGCGSSRAISPTPTNLPAAPTTAGSIPAAATELPPPPVSVTQAAPPTPTLIVPPTLPPAPTPEAAT